MVEVEFSFKSLRYPSAFVVAYGRAMPHEYGCLPEVQDLDFYVYPNEEASWPEDHLRNILTAKQLAPGEWDQIRTEAATRIYEKFGDQLEDEGFSRRLA